MKITVEFESMEEFRANMMPGREPSAEDTKPVESGSVQEVQKGSVPVSQASQTITPVVPVAQTVPASAPAASAPTEAVPTAAPSYSSDDLAKACITLMDQGRQKDLQNLLAQFGVTALPQLMKEQYGAFATALRGMGAPI